MKSKDLYPGLVVALRPYAYATSVTLRLIASVPDSRGRWPVTHADGRATCYPRHILPQQVIPVEEAQAIVDQQVAEREQRRKWAEARNEELSSWKSRYGVGSYTSPVESYITGDSTVDRLTLKVRAPEHIIAKITEILQAEHEHYLNGGNV